MHNQNHGMAKLIFVCKPSARPSFAAPGCHILEHSSSAPTHCTHSSSSSPSSLSNAYLLQWKLAGDPLPSLRTEHMHRDPILPFNEMPSPFNYFLAEFSSVADLTFQLHQSVFCSLAKATGFSSLLHSPPVAAITYKTGRQA